MQRSWEHNGSGKIIDMTASLWCLTLQWVSCRAVYEAREGGICSDLSFHKLLKLF